ncbi:hypothetical protein B0H11DRAFT_1909750 [Mycena galericulata]|nr:hypothetical protein B0H11DRAFT_1909750 [Mycena galericulata]
MVHTVVNLKKQPRGILGPYLSKHDKFVVEFGVQDGTGHIQAETPDFHSTGLSHEGNTIYSNDWVGELNVDSWRLQELAREAKEGIWDTLPICAIAEAHKRKAEHLMARGNPDYNGSSNNSEVYVEFLRYLWLYPHKNDPEYNGAFAGASDRWSSLIRIRRFTQASWRTYFTTLQVGDTRLYLRLASSGEQIKAHILVCKND